MNDTTEAAVWARVRAAQAPADPWSRLYTGLALAADTYAALLCRTSGKARQLIRQLHLEARSQIRRLNAMAYAATGSHQMVQSDPIPNQTTAALLRQAWQAAQSNAAVFREAGEPDSPFQAEFAQMEKLWLRHSAHILSLLQQVL